MSFVGSLFSSAVSSSEDESETWDGNPDHQPTRNPVSIPIRNDVDANALGARAAAPTIRSVLGGVCGVEVSTTSICIS